MRKSLGIILVAFPMTAALYVVLAEHAAMAGWKVALSSFAAFVVGLACLVGGIGILATGKKGKG